MTKIGIIGSGNMGQALIQGWLHHGHHLAVYSPHRGALIAKKYDIKSFSLVELAKWSDVLVLAFLPHQLAEISAEINLKLQQEQILISVLGGVDLGQLAQAFTTTPNLVRTLPNTNIAVNSGEISCALAPTFEQDKRKTVNNLLKELGLVFDLPEDKFLVFSAIAGSGPAVVAKFSESLVLAAVKNGLTRDEAVKIVTELIIGTMINSKKTEISFNDLIYQICSPGGTTIRGIETLEKSGFSGIIMESIDKMLE
ncbi:pyrroline-5-carboxylate reductase family protein [Xylocopilactobacillus apicola]|uniref:Pyrroline-5-carboxylate reductase n=1 Tax=Xylocopilactobacillus apicola TaxID=2932184 RepID=A0AAU9DN51_9LACO|nr:pyrroline-5-carboxylate reductase [Xylocopilactobacillus apicola]BDR58467.1 pyrroline-5-carboxylate reductase [Xylocopilactobacillus apicola]